MLKNKKIFILGASSDIGVEVVKEFISNNWLVYAHYNKNIRSLKKLNLKNKKLKLLQFDLSNFNKLDVFCKKISKIGFHSYINLVGYLDNKSFFNSKLNETVKSLKINTLLPIFIQRSLLKKMSKQNFGRILNISSIGVKYGGSEFTFNYSFAKHALEYFPSIYKKLAKRNVLINILRVGVVNTKLLRKVKGKNIRKRVKLIPMQRMAKAKEISKMIYNLSSEKNTYISGEVITIAGGE